jgi:hypothetical protein
MHVIVAIWGASFYTQLPLKPLPRILKINIDKVPSKYTNFFLKVRYVMGIHFRTRCNK